MPGLFRNSPDTQEGKYLVQRRDGSVPEWPYFVLGAKDPCAYAALMAYAVAAEHANLDPAYCDDIRALAYQFEQYRLAHGTGDPDAPKHREDNPEIIRRMTTP